AWAIDLPPKLRNQPRLQIGLGPEREALVRTLADHTGTEGRILFEERPADGPDAGWTALLAERTGRQFVGGLAPRWGVEHLFARLADGKLAGRPIGEWSDDELLRFCGRYNICWAVCWSNEAQARFGKLPGARAVAEVRDGGQGVLFALRREANFILRGRA